MTAAAWLLLLCAQDGANRLWWLDVEVAGPGEEFTLDCGADGTTRVHGPFLYSADRRLSVPVPVRSPLGRAGLATLPLPKAEGAGVRVVGWSAAQPGAELSRGEQALLLRGRPPAGGRPARAGGPETWLVLLLLPLLVRLRRNFAWFALAAVLGGGFAFARTRTRPAERVPVGLFDMDLHSGACLVVRGAREEIELPRTRLEARPEGARLHLDYPTDGSLGTVRAPGAVVLALEPNTAFGVTPQGGPGLASAWLRSPEGSQTFHGPWPERAALPPVEADGPAPPGWLTGALPPGTGVLLGQFPGGFWLRATGFPREEPPDGY